MGGQPGMQGDLHRSERALCFFFPQKSRSPRMLTLVGVRLMLKKRWFLMLLAAAPSALAGQSDPVVPEIDAIRVQVSRFEEPFKDALPQTTLITADEIQKSGATSVSEVLSQVGGVPTRLNLDGSTNAVVDLGGYGDTADNNVVILLNGVRLSENEQATARTSMIPLELIDHIEITRGGNSVLYGDGASSGSINIVTRRHEGDKTVIEGGGGSYSSVHSSLFHSTEFGDKEFQIFAKQNNAGAYREDSRISEDSIGFQFVDHLNQSADVGVMVFATREHDLLPGALPLAWLNTNPRASEVPGYVWDSALRSSVLTVFGRTEFRGIEFTLDLSQRIRSNNNDYSYDASTVYSGYETTPGWTQAYASLTALTQSQTASPRLQIPNFLLSGNLLQMGFDWMKTDKAGNAHKTDSLYPNTFDDSITTFSSLSRGLFVRDTLQLSANDRVLLGARIENYEDQFLGNYAGYLWPWLESGRVSATELEYARSLAPHTDVYVRGGRSFRIPNVDDFSSASNLDSVTNYPILLPQASRDITLGLRHRGQGYRTELSYFYSDISQEIGFDPNVGGNVNFDPTRRTGLHLLEAVSVSDRWGLRINLDYVEAKFVSGAYAGMHIPNVARFTGSVGLTYAFLPKHELGLTTRLASARYLSGDFYNSEPQVPGYGVFDLAYTYRERRWSWFAKLSNLLDKSYTDTGVYQSDSNYLPLYRTTVYPNPGRSISVGGRYAF